MFVDGKAVVITGATRGGFKIEAEFCDGIKKMETVFSGDKLLRRKYYGQD